MRTILGLVGIWLFFMLVLGFWLEWLTLPSAGIVGLIVWIGFFFWRNFGGGNPVLAKIKHLRQQNEYAEEDIRVMTVNKVKGYKTETKHLRSTIDRHNEEISLLERTQNL